jgi:hypothetical protein
MVSADKDKEEIIQVPSELKTKLAHKRVGINRWSLTENVQREQLIKILEDYVVQLKREKVMNPLRTLLQ